MEERSRDPAAAVRALFEAAGLQPNEQEIQIMSSLFPLLRERLRSLYQVDLGED